MDEPDQTLAMLDTYKDQIGIRQRGRGNSQDKNNSTILLTGATGGIGIHVLHSLVLRRTAKTIICPVRASTDTQARSRLDTVLHRHFLPSLSELGSTVTIQCFALNSLRDGWLDSLPRRPIHVLHLAWPVNFKRPLSSFGDAFADIVALLNFSLETGSQFYYASSIAASFNSPCSIIPAALAGGLEEASITGYSRSKWLAEHLIAHASQTYGLKCGVFRIGQICGDTKHGIWNEREAVPLMIHAATIIGVIPNEYTDGVDQVSWMPVDRLAEGLVATLDPRDETLTVWNFVSPVLTHWDRITQTLHRCLGVEVVSYDEWIAALQRHQSSDLPAIKLFHWYSSGLYPSRKYDMASVDRLLSHDLGQGQGRWAFTEVDERMVERMVEAWRRSGFLPAKAIHREAKL